MLLYIFDRDDNLLEILTEYEDFNYNLKLNSDRICGFTSKKNNNLKRYNKVGFFDKDEKFQLFFIDDIEKVDDYNTSKLNITCMADYYRLGNYIIDDKRSTNINDAITKALEGSDYKVGIVESFENRNINFYHISGIKALNEIIKTFECEFDVRIEIDQATGKIGNKFIELKHRLGEDTGLRFTFDTALEVLNRKVITEGHFNVLWGFGKSLETENGGYSRKLDFAAINNGLKYVEDLDSISKYGRLEGIFEDGNITDKSILLTKTREKLQKTKDLKVSYSATLKDIIGVKGFEHYKVMLGDTIIILGETIDEIIEARVIEINYKDDDINITLGNFLSALTDEDFESEIGSIKDKIDTIETEKPTIDTIYPDTLPDVPVLTSKALYSSVILEWTYSNKDYYTYELFASQLKDFNPSPDNRIFEGKASSFLHEVKPSQTWYYRVRAKNTYGKTTLFSTQVEGVTFKISDATEFFEDVAISHALIRDLDMDKATVGKLKGQFIEAKNLEVIDGNDHRTLYIDSFGNVNLDVTKLSIKSKDVEKELEMKVNQSELTTKADEIYARVFKETDANNVLVNGAFEDSINGYEGWKADLSVHSGVLTINAVDTATDYGFITPRFNLEEGNLYTLSFDANSYYNTLKLNYCYLMDTQYGNIRLDSDIQLDAQGFTTRVKLTFKTADKYRNVRLLIGYEGAIDSTTGFRVANLMLAKGEHIRNYTPKAASFTEVEMRFRPDSIVQNINQGLEKGSKIAVAGTVLDSNGFSQLNNGKLSVRLNNNGTHVYSFLNEGKINGSIQALRQTRTNDDIMAMTHESNSFLAIDYPKPNELGTYWDYVIFDIYKLINPIPITFSTDTDFSGYNIWLNKRSADVGSRIFGGKRDDGRGYAALHGTNLQFVDPSSGNFHFNVTREMFDIYSSEVQVRNSLKVYGNKNCIQETKYGDIPFYANEDINSLLTETEIDNYLKTEEVDGKFICKVNIDDIIQECLNTEMPYNVYIDKKDFGDYRVDIKESTYFIVESDRPIRFKYKLEARRKNFEGESKYNNFIRKMTVQKPIINLPSETNSIDDKSRISLYKKE